MKITNYISTGLFTALMLFSAANYVFNHETMVVAFSNLGFPSWIIYPVAVAKLVGLAALWFSKSDTLKEWAYAGFFFNILLAFGAHISIADGEFPGALMAFALSAVSYYSWKKLKA
jgi:hypothetical protein